MLETIAALVGFFGAALIGFAVIGGTNRPRTIAIVGTVFVTVAFILFLLIAFKVTNGN